MTNDSHDDAKPSKLVAEMRAVADETRRVIETSQAILDSLGARTTEPALPARGEPETLGEISDGLIHAYTFAKRDSDPLTAILIEKALLHVGRRIARGLTPGEAGLVCH